METLLRVAGGITLGYAIWLAFSFLFNVLWWWHFCKIVRIPMGVLRTLIMTFVIPTIYIVFPYIVISVWVAARYNNPHKWQNYKYFCVLTWKDRATANERFGERHIELSPRAQRLLITLLNKVDAAQQKVKAALAAIVNKNGR
jgi:hypothetical protein